MIAAQGDYSESAQASVSWTLGEVASSYFSTTVLIYNEGFLQPFEDDNYRDLTDEEFLVFPNPTVKDVILLFKNSDRYLIRIYDVIGQIISSNQLDGDYIKLDLSSLATAMYIITIKNTSGEINTSVKLIKIK